MAKSGLKVLAAGLLGVAAGVGIGILIAPAKGSKTRKRLKKQILDIADMVENEISEKVHSVKSAFSMETENDDSTEKEAQPEEEVR